MHEHIQALIMTNCTTAINNTLPDGISSEGGEHYKNNFVKFYIKYLG